MKWRAAIAFVLVAAIAPSLLLRTFTPDPWHEDRERCRDERHRLEPMAAAELPGRYRTDSPFDVLVLHTNGRYVREDLRPCDGIDDVSTYAGFKPEVDPEGSWTVHESFVQLHPELGTGGEFQFGLLEGVPAVVGNTDTWRRAP